MNELTPEKYKGRLIYFEISYVDEFDRGRTVTAEWDETGWRAFQTSQFQTKKDAFDRAKSIIDEIEEDRKRGYINKKPTGY